MKEKILLIASILMIISNSGLGQRIVEPCAFDQIAKMKIKQATEKRIQDGVVALNQNKSSHTLKTIPVVVHIIHTGGTENISEAQVQSQIDILNEDFGKLPGTPGDGNGVDTEVRFCLAKYDPNGNCTNGIVRINSSLANHKTFERPLLKQLSFWDNTRYMNIYVVKSITGGTLGYSSFPGGPAEEDGIVVRHNVFGNIGTAASSMGRTMPHEAGHWFGVYHTFSNGCGVDECSDGDFVCDTPPVSTANFGCPTGVNSCSNDSPDLPDLVDNYMDYSDDACKSMFTQGQADRMQSTLTTIRTAIWSDTNLIFTGCDTNYIAPPTCDVVSNFVALTNDICIGNSVYFMDISLNTATSWSWTFPGGSPTTSSAQNPTITYNALGSYDAILVVSDGVTTDSIAFTNYITVSNPGIGDPLPFFENFENGFPQNGLSIFNADGLGTWDLDSVAPYQGNYCIKIDNLNNPCCGSIDEIYLPYFDLTTVGATPYMKFEWAYAKSDALYSDELIVQLSTDCGNTWNQVFYKTQSSLVTGPTQTTSFIPDSSEWNSAFISLGAYASEQYALLRIVNVPDGGNNLYIDDIRIGDAFVGVEEGLVEDPLWTVYPNPSIGIITVDFKNEMSGKVELFSINGQLIKSFSFINERKQKLDINEFPNGMYQVQITSGNTIQSKPLIIQK